MSRSTDPSKSPPDIAHEVMTFEETAQFLRITAPTLREMLRRGDIPAYRTGRVWRFLLADVIAQFRKSASALKE